MDLQFLLCHDMLYFSMCNTVFV